MRRGRPGLVGTVARTAVVAGTATAVAGGVRNHQEAKAEQAQDAQAYQQQQELAQQQLAAQAAAQQAAAAPAPAAAGTQDVIAQLKELAELRDQGILTDAEFAAQKAKILG
jgi:hypothetical protein